MILQLHCLQSTNVGLTLTEYYTNYEILLKHKLQKFALLWISSLSLDYHELCRNVISTSLTTEVTQQLATLVLGWVTALVH